jgi:thiamine pyrophosphokinase
MKQSITLHKLCAEKHGTNYIIKSGYRPLKIVYDLDSVYATIKKINKHIHPSTIRIVDKTMGVK